MMHSSSPKNLSLVQLEKLMQSRRADVARLTRLRDQFQKKLNGIEAKLAIAAGGIGGRMGAGGKRARNDASLQDVIHQVLTKAGGPVSVGDIRDKVLATGYRSTSANFRGIVNQTLIKDKRFSKAGRGMYQVKK
jgi:hypothetical protein